MSGHAEEVAELLQAAGGEAAAHFVPLLQAGEGDEVEGAGSEGMGAVLLHPDPADDLADARGADVEDFVDLEPVVLQEGQPGAGRGAPT